MSKVFRWLLPLLVIAVFTISGCASTQTSADPIGTTNSPVADAANAKPAPLATPPTPSKAKSPMSNLPRLEGKATVVMTVNGSPITIEVDGINAPVTAGNFVDLVQKGVYDGLVFHRVVRDPQPFVVQGGDPQSKDASVPASMLGTGGFTDPATQQERRIPLEIKPVGATEPIYGKTLQMTGSIKAPALTHKKGAVAMARSQMPDSASSQFYFALADLPFLDGSYAVFGQVTKGMDVVDKIQQGDRIESASVTQGAENLKTAK